MTYTRFAGLRGSHRFGGATQVSRAFIGATALAGALALSIGCSDDGVAAGSGGSGGSAGSGGSSGGSAGSAGSGGSSAGSAGSAGNGGGGAGGEASGPSGTLRVLSTGPELRAPTTAAVRGDNLWVVNGQLGGLFGGAPPVLPFNVVSVPLAGGAVGATTIELPGDGFYPEGIASSSDGTLFVGSLPLGTVVRVAADSTTATPFVAAGVAERGVVGLEVDEARELLWFCDTNPVATVPGGAIVGVSLEDGSEVVRHAMPNRDSVGGDAGTSPPGDAGTDDGGTPAEPAPGAPTFCNDLIVDSTGNLFATDSTGRIFRVPAAGATTANSASVWLDVPEIGAPTPGGFGANGLDIVGGSLVIINIGSGSLVAVDPSSADPASTVRTIRLTLDGAPATLCGPDGLETVPGSATDVVVIENGGCTNPPGGDGDRVVRVTLDLD